MKKIRHKSGAGNLSGFRTSRNDEGPDKPKIQAWHCG